MKIRSSSRTGNASDDKKNSNEHNRVSNSLCVINWSGRLDLVCFYLGSKEVLLLEGLSSLVAIDRRLQGKCVERHNDDIKKRSKFQGKKETKFAKYD